MKKQISECIHTFMDINMNSIPDKCCLRVELIKISSLKDKKQHQEENRLLAEIKMLPS